MTRKSESAEGNSNLSDTAKQSNRQKRENEATLSLQNLASLVSAEAFAAAIGKSPKAVVEMAKAGKLPAFYMSNPQKPNGNAELWINREEWDKYAAQLVEQAPPEWHGWKNRLSHRKSIHK